MERKRVGTSSNEQTSDSLLWVEVKDYVTYSALAKFDLFTGLRHRAALVTGQTPVEFLEELEDSVTELVA